MNASTTASPPGKPTFRGYGAERLLRPFAEVRPGEAGTALLLMANVFLLLTAYYVLKVAREPLILASAGAEVKSYASAGQSFLLIFATWAYGWLAQHVNRMRLITIVTLFFGSNLVLFWFLGTQGVPLGIPFYLWVGIFNVMSVSQFWSFAADVYTEEQGKRLFPIIGIGSSVGAVFGAWMAGHMLMLGPFSMMLVAGAILFACLYLTRVVHVRESAEEKHTAAPEHLPIGNESGFLLLWHDRYLLLIAALTFVLNWVSATGEYVLDRTMLATAKIDAANAGVTTSAFIGAFKASYFQWTNVVGVLLQLFVVSRILKHVGVRRALFVMPLVSLGSYSMLAIWPALSLLFFVKVAENSLNYSLQNTSRQALWLVTSRQAKYKVKQIIDSFVVRAGDVMSAIVVWGGTKMAFRTSHFLYFNLALTLLWLGVLVLLGREYQRRSTHEGLQSGPALANA